MLLGRGRESRIIERLLASAGETTTGALVLRGAAGIGKSALLEWSVNAAAPMRSVAIRCPAEESHNHWSTVRQIVAPLNDALAELLPWQITRLTGGKVSKPVPMDPLTVGAALLALLAHASRDAPILLAIDDAHRADPGSRDALRFVARNIEHEHVIILLTVEEGGEDGFSDILPVMEIAGLSPIDAATLIGDPIDTRVAEQLARVTNGNPLALLELATHLSPEQRVGAASIDAVVPINDTLLRRFTRQTAGLSEDERRLLLLVAADPGLDRGTLRAAARAAEIAPEVITSLVRPGLLEVGADGGIHFAQPLQREALYQEAGANARRSAHRVLASIYAPDADSRARHLAAAAGLGPDGRAADALDAMALRALARGDPAAAGTALVRSAALSDSLADEVRRLVRGGYAFSIADDNLQAIDAFDQALTLTDDPATQAEILIARAAPRLATAKSIHGYHELAQVAERVEPTHRGHAASLRLLAALSALAAGELSEARQLCRETEEQVPSPRERAAVVASALAALLSVLAGSVEDALVQLLAIDAPDPRVWMGRSTLVFEDLVVSALAWLGEFSASSRLAATLVDESRAANAVGVLARALSARADLYLRSGHWDAALADANEAFTLARELGVPGAAVFALGSLARLESGRGRFAESQRHGVEALGLAQQLDLGTTEFWTQGVLGFTALTEGRDRDSVVHLEAARTFAEREQVRLLVAVPWAPDLVEAYVRVGRLDDATRLVGELEDRGMACQGALPAALVARCRGLVTAADADEQFAGALASHQLISAPFEQARTSLMYGERLRRDHRAVEAVRHLEDAAATFDRLGAVPWLRRAHAELKAEGKLATTAPRQGRHALTPQEFRIALAVAQGGTNREVAGSLYLSPRTVEHHLGNVYRKLHIRSRSELAARVATDPEFNVEIDLTSG